MQHLPHCPSVALRKKREMCCQVHLNCATSPLMLKNHGTERHEGEALLLRKWVKADDSKGLILNWSRSSQAENSG